MREYNISVGTSRQSAKWAAQTINFEKLKEKLENPVVLELTQAQYRALSKADRDAAKDVGGIVGGKLKGLRRKKEEVLSRSLIILDGDSLSTSFLDEYELLHEFHSLFYTTCSHTPDAPRGRIIIPLTRDVTPDEFHAISRLLAGELGIEHFDTCSFTPHQLMYWPVHTSDGEYITREFEGKELDPDEYLTRYPNWKDVSSLPYKFAEDAAKDEKSKKVEDPTAKGGIVGAYCRAYTIYDVLEELSDVYEEGSMPGRYTYKNGTSSNGVQVIDGKFVYSFHATDPASGKLLNAFDLYRVHRFPAGDEKKSFKQMAEFANQDPEVKKGLIEERQAQASREFEEGSDEWKGQLEYDLRTSKLKNTLRNLKLIMDNDQALSHIVYNEQSDSLEKKGSVPWDSPSKFWRDADDAQLLMYLSDNYGEFTRSIYEVVVAKVTDDRRYHPIKEYLSALPEWDGVERVDSLLIDYFGAENNAYTRAVTRKTLCAAVQRVYHPGIKFDTMLVLNGGQGIGKSTLIKKLAGEWFSDSLILSDTKDSKTAAEKLQGYWILEIGELAGLRKAEEETLKGFLSRQNDIYRAAFGRRTAQHPRQCIFIGTTNAESGYLRDTTGGRRFWPVETPGTGVKKSWDLTHEEVDQIWAEVIVRVNEGERLYLTKDEEALAKEEQIKAMETDEKEGLIRDFLETALPENWDDMDLFARRNWLTGEGVRAEGKQVRDCICTLEIWCECFGKDRSSMNRSDSASIISALIKLGWAKQARKKKFKLYGAQFFYTKNQKEEKREPGEESVAEGQELEPKEPVGTSS